MIPVDLSRAPDWLLEIFHLEPDRIPAGARAWISLERFPGSGWGLLAVLAILAGFLYTGWVYRREGALGRGRKIGFAVLRCLVILSIATALFCPVLEVSVERDQRAVTLVLLDDSLSFGIRDGYRGNAALRKNLAEVASIPVDELPEWSRADLALRLIGRPQARFFERLAARNSLKLYRFSGGLAPVSASPVGTGEDPAAESDVAGSPPAITATEPGAGGEPTNAIEEPVPLPALERGDLGTRGLVTDIGGALRSAVEAQGNTPVAAIVLITDGRRTAGEDPAGVASFLADREIPVHAIGIGDPTPTRNLRVLGVFAPERVFTGDPLAVDVRVDHHGFDDEAVEVRLLEEEIGPADTVASREVGREQVSLTAGSEATVQFDVRLQSAGRRRLVARIDPREDETFDADNERAVIVEVVEQATRVLYVAGAPSSEYRILRNLLRRDRRVFLASWLMSADAEYPQEGDTVLERLPSSPAELFGYDVVILHDVDPRGLPPGYPDQLETFVRKHRGGLAYICGEKYTTPFFRSSAMRPIHALLPVVPNLPRAEDEFARGRFHLREWPLLPTHEALAHPATRLSSRPDRNRELWAGLAGVYWSFPALKAKPGATVLLRHSDPSLARNGVPRPLLAFQFYAGGRTAFLGIDETWRWRAVAENVYEQFWMQIVRSLTEGRLLGDRRELLLTDRDVYDLGDVIRLSAFIQDETYTPSDADSITVTVTHAGQREEVVLRGDPSQRGWFRGVHMPGEVGVHELSIDERTSRTVQVDVPDLEYDEPRLDPVTLGELAERTGGSVVVGGGLDAYAEIPSRIPDRRRRIVQTDEPRPLWDNAITLALVVGLLTIEWIGRKWSRLP